MDVSWAEHVTRLRQNREDRLLNDTHPWAQPRPITRCPKADRHHDPRLGLTATCTAAQFNSVTCPAASKIGQAQVSMYGYYPTQDNLGATLTWSAQMYVTGTSGSTVSVGIASSTNVAPYVNVWTATGTITTTAGVSTLALTTIGHNAGPSGQSFPVQVTDLDTELYGTVDAGSFITNPSTCTSQKTTSTYATIESPLNAALTSSFTPTGC